MLSNIFAGKVEGVKENSERMEEKTIMDDSEMSNYVGANKNSNFENNMMVGKMTGNGAMQMLNMDAGGSSGGGFEKMLGTSEKGSSFSGFDNMLGMGKQKSKKLNINKMLGTGLKGTKKSNFGDMLNMGNKQKSNFGGMLNMGNKQKSNFGNMLNMGYVKTTNKNLLNVFPKGNFGNKGMNFEKKMDMFQNKSFNNINMMPERTGRNRMKQQKELSLFGDFDMDKKLNIFDCNPLDSTKQAWYHKLIGGEKVQTPVGGLKTYEEEKPVEEAPVVYEEPSTIMSDYDAQVSQQKIFQEAFNKPKVIEVAPVEEVPSIDKEEKEGKFMRGFSKVATGIFGTHEQRTASRKEMKQLDIDARKLAKKEQYLQELTRRYRKPKTTYKEIRDVRKALSQGASGMSYGSGQAGLGNEEAKVRSLIGMSSGGRAPMASAGSSGGFYDMVPGRKQQVIPEYETQQIIPQGPAPQGPAPQGPAPPGKVWSVKSQRWVSYRRPSYRKGYSQPQPQYQQY